MNTNDQFSTVLEELHLGDTTIALRFLGAAWRGIGKRPRATGSSSLLAERLLLSGILTSRLASDESLNQANDSAQRLLNDSYELFTRLNDPRQHTALIESALSYSRAGQWEPAFERVESIRTTDQIINIERVLAQTAISIDANQYDDAIVALTSIASSAGSISYFLRGVYYQLLAAARFGLAGQQDLSTVLDNYESAQSNYEDGGSLIGQASVHFDLVQVLSCCSEAARALYHAREARQLFTRLNNQLMLARTEHLEAEIYFLQGDYSDASRAARRAAERFQECNHKSLRAKTLVILGRSLARVDQVDAAQDELNSAAIIFDELDDTSARVDTALTMIEELPLPSPLALHALALATRLAGNAELRERTRLASCKVGAQLIGDNTRRQKELNNYADEIKTRLVTRTLAKHGGPNARGAILRTADELGITHSALIGFLDQHPKLGHKKRPRSILRSAA